MHLHIQHDLYGHSQHLLPHPACRLHKQLTIHHHKQYLLLASASALQHLLRVCQHRLALQRTMKHPSMHHHHNDLMTTTPPSELKIQGVVSSQTQRQAEPTSRSRTGLMQWSSVVGSIISSYRSEQLPSAAKSITCKHQCKEEKLTSASGHREERLSSVTVITPRREFEHRHRGEDHQSVIMFDYTFLTNPHQSSQQTSEGCHQDVEERGTSKQQKSSWSDEARQSIVSWSAITSVISGIIERTAVHLTAMLIIAFNTLLYLHQVWPVHLMVSSRLSSPSSSSTCASCTSVCTLLGRAQPSHLEH